jgi:hypothetical protein
MGRQILPFPELKGFREGIQKGQKGTLILGEKVDFKKIAGTL